MVIISMDLILKYKNELLNKNQVNIKFVMVDEGDAFLEKNLTYSDGKKRKLVKGILSSNTQLKMNELPKGINVLVTIRFPTDIEDIKKINFNEMEPRALIKSKKGFESHTVQVVPIRENIFSRIDGIYETDVLREKTVLIIGLGSGGAPVAMELAKAGVGNFILIDPDRLEVENIARHLCGVSDLGRYKTKAVRDLIKDKNPYVNIKTYEIECNWNWIIELKKLVGLSDLVLCCTDNRPSRVIVNVASISKKRICIYGGTFRRAYGGQVFRVIPHHTPCYQCFISSIHDRPEDQEISSATQAERIAYSDRPVAIEPGLSSDIAPIVTMCVKIGILEMIKGTDTTLKNLYEDLSSPLYQWLNRREIGTDFEKLRPLDSGYDQLRILAWYGIDIDKNPNCPVCGNFIEYQKKRHGIYISDDKIAAFE